MPQQMEGWGAGVIPRLVRRIRNEFPAVKGFSEPNIGHIIRFFREWGKPPFLQQAAAKLPASSSKAEVLLPPVAKAGTSGNHPDLQQLVVRTSWGHRILLMEKVKGK